jgi:hypothetical protein
MSELNSLLVKYVYDTENAEINYDLAQAYFLEGQTAAALSFFLRAAERTTDKLLAYECMLYVGFCFELQGNRVNSVRGAYKHAICILPDRPEAYYFLSRINERSNWYIESYVYAEMGLNFGKFDLQPLRSKTEYPGKYGLIFEKAVSAWWWGKVEECTELFLELKYKHNLDHVHLSAVNNNITKLNIDESKYKVFDYTTKKQMPEWLEKSAPNISGVMDDSVVTVVVQGQYNKHTNDVIESYLQMPFVGDVIVSCWEDDPKETIHSSRVKFVRNKKPLTPGTDNRNLQITSSLAGLKKSTTKTTLKVRSDQIYTKESLQIMRDYYEVNKKSNTLFVSGLFPSLLFHPNDHIFWGETSDLIALFDIPLEFNGLIDKIKVGKDKLHKYYNHFIRSETYIGAHYCAKFNEEINLMLLQPDKFLYDGAPNWQQAHELSKQLTNVYFKSFPKTGMEMYWASKGIQYPYEEQKLIYNQCWSEDGY